MAEGLGRRAVLAGLAGLAVVRPAAAAVPQLGLVILDTPRPLPSLALLDAAGGPAGLDTLGHGRPGLLNLWASWCPPCVAELPMLDRMVGDLERRGVGLMALSLDRDPAIARATWKRLGMRALLLRTGDSAALIADFAARILPVTVLVDAETREIGRFNGAADWAAPAAGALIAALAAGRPLEASMEPPAVRF
jgi:thiol-disulfide isomerase/thioredoxin